MFRYYSFLYYYPYHNKRRRGSSFFLFVCIDIVNKNMSLVLCLVGSINWSLNHKGTSMERIRGRTEEGTVSRVCSFGRKRRAHIRRAHTQHNKRPRVYSVISSLLSCWIKLLFSDCFLFSLLSDKKLVAHTLFLFELVNQLRREECNKKGEK